MNEETFTSPGPLRLHERSPGFKMMAVLMGTLILCASSYITVPMIPVPMTMQTFAVTLIGAVYGWRLGALTVVAWLLEGALGLPVMAGGAAGLVHLFGKTGGYLVSFPIVAALVGWLAERGWSGRRPVLAFWAMLAGNLLCLAIGAAWLWAWIGWESAVVFGITPFLLGAALKSLLGAAVLNAAFRRT